MAPYIRATGTWEPLEVDWLNQNVRRGQIVLNVGANVGYHALRMSRLVGGEGRVIAVEPDPINFNFLLLNVAFHNVGNVSPIQCAAGSTRGTGRLFRGADNPGDNRLVEFKEAMDFTEVPVRRMDDILKGIHIDAVLIDAQGWDHEVVRGMTGLLEVHRPPMIVEMVPSWLSDRGIDPVGEVRFLQELGYRVGVLEAGLAPGASAEEVVAACTDSGTGRWFANLNLEAAN